MLSNNQPADLLTDISAERKATNFNLTTKEIISNNLAIAIFDRIPKKSLKEKFSTIFGRKKYVQVSLENARPVFVRISDLSQAMGLSTKIIRKSYDKKGAKGVRNLINDHNQLVTKYKVNDQLMKKINQWVNKSKNFESLRAFSQLSIEATPLKKILDNPRFQNSKFQKTLIKAGQVLQQARLSENNEVYIKKGRNHYGFIIKDNEVYIREKLLGKGAFKKALAAINIHTMEGFAHLAIKDTGRGKATREVQTETNIAQRLTDEQGNTLEGIEPSAKFKITVREGKVGKEKYVMMKKRMIGDGTKLLHKPFNQKMKAMHNVAKGLANMHEKNLIHNDFKLTNMLVDKEGMGYLSDFGLATNVGQLGGGTPAFQSPEANKANKNPAMNVRRAAAQPVSDSFSFGITMLYLISPELFISLPKGLDGLSLLKSPFMKSLNKLKQKDIEKLIAKAQKHVQNDHSLSNLEKKQKTAALELTKALLTIDPANRMTMQMAVRIFDQNIVN